MVVLLMVAPSFQESEPPANPGRFISVLKCRNPDQSWLKWLVGTALQILRLSTKLARMHFLCGLTNIDISDRFGVFAISAPETN